MSEDRVIIQCHNCVTKIRFPIKENLIKFSCPDCKTPYKALNGEIIDEKKEHNTGSDNSQTFKPKTKEKTSASTAETSTISNRKKSNTNKNGMLAWQVSTIVLAFAVIFLVCLAITHNSDRREKDRITYEFLATLSSKKKDFGQIKSYLTEETKKTFEMLIENQYAYDDSESVQVLDRFLNTLQPLDYQENRRFKYMNPSGDTQYFNVDFIPNGKSFLLNVELNQFLSYQ